MAPSCRLGLLSTARINDAIIAAAAASPQVEVVAVGSRDADRAAEYAAERSIPRAHGSYEELLADDGIDAVYISTPNGLHAPWARAALEAGRHVLCEKPVDSDPEVVDGLFALAAERRARAHRGVHVAPPAADAGDVRSRARRAPSASCG